MGKKKKIPHPPKNRTGKTNSKTPDIKLTVMDVINIKKSSIFDMIKEKSKIIFPKTFFIKFIK